MSAIAKNESPIIPYCISIAREEIRLKFFVTGGQGYLGRHVVNWLVSKGQEVVVASRREGATVAGAEVVTVDILTAPDDVYEIAGNPDVMIDLAWEDGFKHASPKHLDNLPKHVEFIRKMLKGGLPHLVGLGTMHEVGYHVGPISELTPTFPLNPYGIAKDHLRKVQEHYCKEFNAVNQWLRCYYIYGDDEINNSIFTKLLAAEKENKEEFPLNSGELLYDFIEVRELGAQIGSVSSQSGICGIINCCSGEPTSLKTMVLRFIEERGLSIKPNWGSFPLRPYDSRAVWGDRNKLDDALARATLKI